jgi:spore maturation protein CgeB
LNIYGSGWVNDARFKAHAQGEIFDREELCKAYNASKISLNISHTSNNHPRIFDIIASGGFLLTRLTTEDEDEGGIGELFEIGKEIEVFRTKEELRRKVEYYLAHDEEREAIARSGRERLLKEHTMKHRMQQVLDIVYQGLLKEEEPF